MQVIVNIPDNSTLFFDSKNIEKQIKLNNSLILFKQSKISISKASELAELNIYDFMKECKKNNISVIDYDDNEFNEEYCNAKKLIK